MPRDLTIAPRTAQQNARAAIVTFDDLAHAQDTAKRRCTRAYQSYLNATEIEQEPTSTANDANQ